jgi:hypothetical protein
VAALLAPGKRYSSEEIAAWRRAVIAQADDAREPHNGLIDAGAERLVERDADARQDAPANEVKETERDVEATGENREAEEGRHAAAWEHPVVDFQHEHGAGEHEDVAHAAEQPGGDEGAAAGGERRGKLGAIEGYYLFASEGHLGSIIKVRAKRRRGLNRWEVRMQYAIGS